MRAMTSRTQALQRLAVLLLIERRDWEEEQRLIARGRDPKTWEWFTQWATQKRMRVEEQGES